MPSLEAYRAQRQHSHSWAPLTRCEDLGVELEVCDCGAVRPVQRPETD